jgi:hypothetical protein
VIIVVPFAASTSASASSFLLHSGLVSDVTELTEDSTSTEC